MNIILDAWALLALLFKEEPAAGKVKQVIEQVEVSEDSIHISWINLGELFYTIARKKNEETATEVLNNVKKLPVKLHEPGNRDIISAASVKSKYKLSYADAFAVSLTQKLEGIIWTGDPEIISLTDIITVEKLYRTDPALKK